MNVSGFHEGKIGRCLKISREDSPSEIDWLDE